MELSVVVTTLNGREALAECLASLSEAAPAEVIVVNGPSADGTTGMVRERDDVSVLLELADRNVNVARNAGAAAATGDVVAFLDARAAVEPGWRAAVAEAVADGADAVTGPVRYPMRVGTATTTPEREGVGERTVTHLSDGNVAFDRAALQRLDGFDEYLPVGGERDAAHRIAGLDLRLDWRPDAAVRRPDGGGEEPTDWRWEYRAIAYSVAKNYGLDPGTAGRTLLRAARDGVDALRDVLAGDVPASRWFADGRDVVGGGLRGALDGLLARRRGGPARNPNGLSSRDDRVVRRYDWR